MHVNQSGVEWSGGGLGVHVMLYSTLLHSLYHPPLGDKRSGYVTLETLVFARLEPDVCA